MWTVSGDERGGNEKQCSNFKCAFNHMRKSYLFKLISQEAHLTSAIVARLYFLQFLNSGTVFFEKCIAVMEFLCQTLNVQDWIP